MAGPTKLDALNATPDRAAAESLRAVCSSSTWVQAVVRRRPFAEVDDLFAVADEELEALSEADLDEALGGHPRIGERTGGSSSRREQAGVDGDETLAALADANAAYEQRFGHVYLVCATGRSGEELLDILRDRLGNDPVTERRVLRTELAAINRIRLRHLVEEDA